MTIVCQREPPQVPAPQDRGEPEHRCRTPDGTRCAPCVLEQFIKADACIDHGERGRWNEAASEDEGQGRVFEQAQPRSKPMCVPVKAIERPRQEEQDGQTCPISFGRHKEAKAQQQPPAKGDPCWQVRSGLCEGTVWMVEAVVMHVAEVIKQTKAAQSKPCNKGAQTPKFPAGMCVFSQHARRAQRQGDGDPERVGEALSTPGQTQASAFTQGYRHDPCPRRPSRSMLVEFARWHEESQ